MATTYAANTDEKAQHLVQSTGSCLGCARMQDEPWAGKWKTAHICTGEGECKGRTVGFDSYYLSQKPAWCPDIQGGLHIPAAERKQEIKRTEIHPGSPEANPTDRKKEAARRWRDLRSHIEETMRRD